MIKDSFWVHYVSHIRDDKNVRRALTMVLNEFNTKTYDFKDLHRALNLLPLEESVIKPNLLLYYKLVSFIHTELDSGNYAFYAESNAFGVTYYQITQVMRIIDQIRTGFYKKYNVKFK